MPNAVARVSVACIHRRLVSAINNGETIEIHLWPTFNAKCDKMLIENEIHLALFDTRERVRISI